jgi:hypothetical protein
MTADLKRFRIGQALERVRNHVVVFPDDVEDIGIEDWGREFIEKWVRSSFISFFVGSWLTLGFG